MPRPAFVVGMSFLVTDIGVCAREAKRIDFDSLVLIGNPMSNPAQAQLAIRMIMNLGKNRIELLGMAIKPETDVAGRVAV